MAIYKAIVTDKRTRIKSIIECEYNTKAEFIHDLRKNGYSVNPIKAKTKEVFDYIMDNTDCNPWDWKEINAIPQEVPEKPEQPEPQQEPQLESQPESQLEPQPEPQQESQQELQPEPQLESQPEPQQESQQEPPPEPQPASPPEPQPAS